MAIAGVAGTDYTASYYHTMSSQTTESFLNSTSTAISQTEEENDSRVLGITMVPEDGSNMLYGMKARYAKESTKTDPVIQVTSNYGGETLSYNVHVNEVGPKAATPLEMFALLSYTDDQGISTHSSFGSFQQLKVCQMNASINGYCQQVSGYENFLHTSYNWEDITKRMMNDYLSANDYNQYQRANGLLAAMSHFGSSEVSDKAVNTGEVVRSDKFGTKDYMQVIRDKIKELFVKVKNKETEPTFQIGGATYTEKEWDKLLEKVDTIVDAIKAALKEAAKEEESTETVTDTAKEKTSIKETDASKEEKEETLEEKILKSLVTDKTTCTYPTGSKKKEDSMYITWYASEGIYCRQQGQRKGYLWSIEYTEEGQYDKVMGFLKNFDPEDNLRFASHENFWQDFLDGKVNEEDFLDFYRSTNQGISDYTKMVGDSTFVDKEKAKYAKYMNPFGGHMYSGDEMQKMQEEIMQQVAQSMNAKSNRSNYSGYQGEQIFCQYPGGPLYNAKEIAEKMLNETLA